ncbi:dermonecrotic toxin domain-containing protein [Pseudomonas sp. H3(2019)]|uniref:dermonecrotic toxin domain-containing protein n=1 Tax=Pseudomonas sp. H3(2019) TaxID=2598724 RepID=UPI0011961D63|nr:DUF6543 domain-containing protein [Pseudomonas sp. H3(2019)]TVT84090.1 hypothetical protein FPT12_10800 [Pseudomonas sp. H3(2019)]
MYLSEGQQPTVSTDTIFSEHPDSHYQHLQNAIPEWLGKASPARRQALQNTQPQLLARLQAAPAAQHQELKALNAAHWTAQSDVDQRLEHLQDASAFAEPLLKEALKNRFGLELDVRTTFLRLYVPATTPWFPVKTGARAWTVSLLDAALHNFEEKETQDTAYETDSTYITQPSATGQFDTLPLIKAKLSIPAFTKLCRELDIGGQYKTYLEDNLGFSDPVAATVLRQKIDDSQKAAIRAALQMARMNRDISESYFRLIGGLLDGLQGLRVNGQAVLCHDLTMMSAPLTGIVVFAPDLDQVQKTARVVAYVPDDPEHPIKEYASALEMVIELTRQLRSKDYQQFFSRFVNHEHRGFFFASLNERLAKVKWHPPVAGSSEPTWRETPLDRPDLQTAFMPFNDNLWQHLYQAKLNKILNDARSIAVPTAAVDQKARWAFWDSLVNIASSILQTAAFIIAPFVPVLGEAMMAYMAYQLLDEAFEGIIEWAQGRTTEAFEHFMGTVESLIQLGTFAIGGAIGAGEFRKILPKEIVAFIDRFKPVELPNGQTRYWEPDLARYEQKSIPGVDSRPDERGLHQHQGKQLLPLEDAHFALSESPIPGQYRIEHPTRPDAYKPLVRHNGDGAWHTELEQPLEWDKPTALRRIGQSVESFSPAERETILQVSGYNEDALRKMHVDQEPLPPLLADSIKRFKIDQDLQRFVDQLASDLPEDYLSADPLMQLQLLDEHGQWPASKRLRWVDQQGEVAWQSSSDETLPLIELRQDRLMDGDLLKTLLHSLEDSEIKALLGEKFGGPTPALPVRTQTLRKQLAQLAWQQRTAMFESRYQALERIEDPLAQPITQHDPQLPVSITRELLNTATGDELIHISEGQLPQRQQDLMQLANQEVRVTRAYEGLELDSVSNPDSDTLALHSLKRLPGWSGDVRIEIRERRYEGPMLDSTGRADAPVQKILVRQTDGTYQPYDDRGLELHSATDFYASVLYALPDAERQALNLQIGQTQKLKNAIREQPMERSELRVAISNPPVQEPAIDTLRLLGADGYPRILRTVRTTNERTFTLEERVREIYPGHSPEEVQAFISRWQSHPAGVRGELSRLGHEYERLANDLHGWANDVPHSDPDSGLALTPLQRRADLRNRMLLKDAIQRCWQRQTRGPAGYMLDLREPILGDLPPLNADFSHVSALTISGSTSTHALEPFLQNFPGLLFLDVQNFNLQNLPQSITSLPTLRQLVVRNCGITLSPANQQLLSSLTELSLLDLQDNPLAVAPDIQAMRSLTHLNLANTGISTPPAGLLDHLQFITGRFDGNRITELPDALFTLSSNFSDGLDFADNPLSATTRERVKTHYNRTGKHFGVLAEQADIDRTTTLFPDLTAHQATNLLYRLPGTLAQGRVQLTNWETEYTQLNDNLTHWARNVPERAPSTGQPLNINEQFNEQDARRTFGQQLEQAWRSRLNDQFVSTLEFMGDMPELTADFSHVSSLTLTGNTSISATTPFLQRFTGLRRLDLRDFALDQVPQAITSMPQLNALVLDDCSVVLTPEGQTALSSLNNLDTLELIDNPLGTAPDVTTLPRLTYINLSNAGISNVPAGLVDHPNLSTAIFNGNLITELPDAFFDLPGHRSDGFDFSDNPLSTATRDRIKTYFRETGQDFGVWADKADIDLAKELFPALDSQDASDVIYDLPGTLEDSRLQLGRWRTEITQLSGDLTIWERQVPDRHPVTGQLLNAEQMYAEHVSRAEFKQQLEQFWRRRPEVSRMRDDHLIANLTFSGDMPLMTADFSHVSSLELRGNNAIRATGPFLELFPNLHSLEMHHFTLDQVPQAITRMPALKELTLAHCRVTLTPQSQAALSSLGRLEALNLSDNPLAIAPDIEAMPELNDIRLSNTGIASLPNGLTSRQYLRTAILNGNQITDLPDAFFDLDLDLADGTNLANNPLSSISRDRIKAYYAKNGNDFAVLAEQADIDRARALFSGLDTEGASHVIYKLPGTLEDGRTQLTYWETEIAQLTSDLSVWVDDIPAHNPSTGDPLSPLDKSAERIARNEFRQRLELFWRQRLVEQPELRADSLIADLAFIGDMPELTADFSHVSALAFNGSKALGVSSRFLECFTGLEHLEMRNFALGRVPQAITGMPSLENLVLSNCGVVFEAEAQTALSSLPRLEMLDLFNNPLGHVPDVAALPTLTFIDLSSTGIERVPVGLSSHPRLQTAILSGNRITEFPREIYNLSAEVGDGFDFGNNPLSTTTLEQIKAYYQRTGKDFGVLANQADIDQVTALYPSFSDEQASEFIYRLPGTLADGRIELAHKHTELADLSRDLTVWMTDIPNDPVTGEPLNAEDLLQEQYKRMKFKESLERCWRQIPTEGVSFDEFGFTSNLSIIGDLPVLTADFGHVRELYLTSTGNIAPKASRFLDYFPKLESLAVQGYQLENIPDAVFAMRSLTALSLPECNITLTRQTLDALAGMENLDSLNLRDNLLGLTPDLSNMTRLHSLDLSNSGLTEAPKGLFNSASLIHADLSNNAITEMPIELMEADPDITANFDFRNNPLSPESLQRVAAYYYQTGNTLNITGVAGMPRPTDLAPDVELES